MTEASAAPAAAAAPVQAAAAASATPVSVPGAPAAAPTDVTVAPGVTITSQGEQKPAEFSKSPVNAQAAESAKAQATADAAAAATALEAGDGKPLNLPNDEQAAANDQASRVQPTGNVIFDQVASLLEQKGIKNVNEILAQAAEGAVSLENQAALVEALGEGVAALALNQLNTEIKSQTDQGNAEGKRLKEFAASRFGAGVEQADETWAALQNFARSTESGLTPENLKTFNEMLQAGGVQGEMAINDLAIRYSKSQGFTQVPNLISGDGPTQSGFQPLTKTEYQAEMRTAQAKHGEGSREVEALRNRRSMSITRGF